MNIYISIEQVRIYFVISIREFTIITSKHNVAVKFDCRYISDLFKIINLSRVDVSRNVVFKFREIKIIISVVN